MNLWNWQQQVQIHQSFGNKFQSLYFLQKKSIFSCSLLWVITVSSPLMFRCLCLPQTAFRMVWLLSFVMCWVFAKLSNQYYVATYLKQHISQFWWSSEVESFWWINMWKDCQPENVRECKQSLLGPKRSEKHRARKANAHLWSEPTEVGKAHQGAASEILRHLKLFWFWSRKYQS